MRFFAVAAALVLTCAGTVSSITLGRGPQATEAPVGARVELRCDVNYRNGETILWYHRSTAGNTSYVTFNRDVYNSLDDDRKRRYSVQGSEYWHVFNLRIDDLKVTDDGFFYCGYLERTKFRVLGSARLTVLIHPDDASPACAFNLLDESGSTAPSVGSTVDLTCTWTGGNPAPTAAWYRQGTAMDTQEEKGYVWTRRELTPEDNGMEFACEMESRALDEPRSCTAMPLRILPRAVVTPSVAYAQLGDTVEFECEGSGLPRISSYAWETPKYLTQSPGRFVRYNRNRVVRLLSVKAEDDNLEITCRVETSLGLTGTASAVLRVELPTTAPIPTTSAATTTTTTTTTTTVTTPLTTLQLTTEIGTESKRPETGMIDNGPVSPKTTVAPAPTLHSDSLPVAALPKSAVIGIGVGAAAVLVLIIAVLVVFLRRSCHRKHPIRHDTSMHLVNSTYETVIGGGRVSDDPGYHTYDRPRPVAAVPPQPQAAAGSENGSKPPVRYAKVNKKKPRGGHPLYDKVPGDAEVDLGIGSPGLSREPTYVNQGVMGVREEPHPRHLNAEGLTYAELDLDREGRLHTRKNPTLYAKLK